MGRGSGKPNGGSSRGGNGDLLLIDVEIFGGIALLLLVVYLFVKMFCWKNKGYITKFPIDNRTKLTISDVKSYGGTDHHSYDHHEEDHSYDHHCSDHGGEDV